MGKPTPRELDCLWCIFFYRREHGYSPTIREICVLMHTSSTNAARSFINKLEKKGRLVIKRGIARGILIEEGTEGELLESFWREEVERPSNTETTEGCSSNSEHSEGEG